MKVLFFSLSVILASAFKLFADLPFEKYLVPIELEHQQSGLEGVDAIYIINLERRTEKKKKKYDLFLSNQLYPNFVKAVDGAKLNKKKRLEITYPYKKNALTTHGHVGCILSHLSVLKDAQKRDFDVIWICEDDVIFVKDVHLISYYLKELTRLDPDWDILYTDIGMQVDVENFSKLFKRPNQILESDLYKSRGDVGKIFYREIYRCGTYSYLFSKKGINKVLNFYRNNFLFSPLDMDIHMIPEIKEYSIKEEIVKFDISEISDTKN